jgi:hypothetical protein
MMFVWRFGCKHVDTNMDGHADADLLRILDARGQQFLGRFSTLEKPDHSIDRTVRLATSGTLESDDNGNTSSDPEEWYGIDKPHDADAGSENDECMLTAPFQRSCADVAERRRRSRGYDRGCWPFGSCLRRKADSTQFEHLQIRRKSVHGKLTVINRLSASL